MNIKELLLMNSELLTDLTGIWDNLDIKNIEYPIPRINNDTYRIWLNMTTQEFESQYNQNLTFDDKISLKLKMQKYLLVLEN